MARPGWTRSGFSQCYPCAQDIEDLSLCLFGWIVVSNISGTETALRPCSKAVKAWQAHTQVESHLRMRFPARAFIPMPLS